MANDILNEKFAQIEVMGIYGLFSNGRIPKDVIPEGLHRYNLRGSDYDPGYPVSVEREVVVNHAGTLVLLSPLDLGEAGRVMLNEENGLNFIGSPISINELHRNQVLLTALTAIERPEQLIASAAKTGLSMTAEEAALVLNYLEGCDYALLESTEGQMFRHDIEDGANYLFDDEYSIVDAVDFAVDSNADLISEISASFPSADDQEYLAQLCSEETVLDALHSRMMKQMEKPMSLAQRLAAARSAVENRAAQQAVKNEPSVVR